MLGKGGRDLPCGLDWGRGGEWGGDTLLKEGARTLGLRAVCAPVTYWGSRRRGRVGAGQGAEPGERAGDAADFSGADCAPGGRPAFFAAPAVGGGFPSALIPSCCFQSRWLHLVLCPPGFTQCAVGAQ